jgi:hypothetical protein
MFVATTSLRRRGRTTVEREYIGIEWAAFGQLGRPGAARRAPPATRAPGPRVCGDTSKKPCLEAPDTKAPKTNHNDTKIAKIQNFRFRRVVVVHEDENVVSWWFMKTRTW